MHTLRFSIGLLSLVLLSCASSRTDVMKANKTTQAVLTGGQSLLNSDPTPKVQLKISGNIITSEKCQFLKKDLDVEIRPASSIKYIHTTHVTEQNTYTFDVGLPSEGPYNIQLVDSKSNQVIESRSFEASKINDRFSFDFQGCP